MAVARAAEVVIVGAGAVGCSIAYHLAKRGQRDVVVIERAAIGAGSTSKAAGGIRAQFATELEIRFSLEGIEAFQRFHEELGVDIGYVQDGYMFVLTDERTLVKFRKNVELQNRWGVPSRIISSEEARELAPQLEIDDMVGASWCPMDGHATPNDVCMAYAAQARKLGVRFVEETVVTGMRSVGGRATVVDTIGGAITSPCVINAAGPNAGPVARMLGVEIPVYPKRRHIFVTDRFDEFHHPTPLVIDTGSGFYCRSEGQGVLMSPGDAGDVTDYADVPVDWTLLEEAVDKGIRRFPVLEHARVRSAWAGLRPLTPDQHAIIDWLPGVEGVFCAVGFGGHGFQHAPATGRYVAEWLLDGHPSLDLSPLSFARFQDVSTAVADAGSVLSGVD